MKFPATVAFHTLGCKLNQAETELLARQFAAAGYSVVSGNGADICVLNTCTVTHIADRKCRRLMRLWRKRNPQALLVATGCYVERAPRELLQAGADLVVGNEHKLRLLELIREERAPARHRSEAVFTVDGSTRIRSFVKIQDGCDNACAYCIVPQVRGSEYSLPLTEVVDEVSRRVAAGCKEVVLTGTKVAAYNHNGANLRDLLQRVLADTGVERLRLSSLQPQEISPQLLSLWQDHRLCPHFHLALQSGSDAVLRRMKRRYSTADYRDVVSLIRNMVPGAAITTDIMVGFPGESDQEFAESYQFCQEIGFARIHVFSYSPRPGTVAAQMPQQVHEKVKRERSWRMLKLAEESSRRFCQQFLGQSRMVLWERELSPGSGVYSGLTDNYIRVFTRSCLPLTNQLLLVRLVGLHGDGLWAEVVG